MSSPPLSSHLLPQRLAQNLSHVGLRELVPEVDVARGFVGGEGLAAEVDYGAFREGRVFADHKESNDFAGVLFGAALYSMSRVR